MKINKTKLVNILWVIYAIFSLGFGNLVFTKIADLFHFDAAIGLIVCLLCFIISVVIVLIIRFNQNKKEWEYPSDDSKLRVISLILTNVILVLGIGFRVYIILFNNIDIMPTIYYFACWIVGAILFVYAAFSLYGPIVSLLFSMVLMFTPYFVNSSIEIDIKGVYFLLSGLLLFLFCLNFPIDMSKVWLFALSGVTFGFLVYVEPYSFVFLLLIFCVFFAKKKKNQESNNDLKFIALSLFLICAIFVYVFLIFAECSMKHVSLGVLFGQKGQEFIPVLSNGRVPIEEFDIYTGGIIAFLLILGIPSGFFRKGSSQGGFLFLMFVFTIAFSYVGFGTKYVDIPSMTLTFASLLSIIGFDNLFHFYVDDEKKEIHEDENDSHEDEKDYDVDEQKKIPETDKKPAVKLLDNPLPIPVKVKRGEMDYDIEISDDDDYDI